jgi:hypothetical protein
VRKDAAREVLKNMENRVYDLHPAIDEFRRLYEENIAENINWGDMVEVFGAVDEDRMVRTRLADELQETVDRAGAYLDTQIVYASRSGYSWLAEYVIPRLRGLKPRKVIIQVKPETDCGVPAPVPHIPSEMEGIEGVIARDLRIALEDVIFEEYTGKADWTYVCLSENAKGVRRVAGSFKSRFSGARFSGKKTADADGAFCVGQSHGQSQGQSQVETLADAASAPMTTGYIQVFINNDKVLDSSLKTEAEQVWEIYFAEILPELVAYLKERNGREGDGRGEADKDSAAGCGEANKDSTAGSGEAGEDLGVSLELALGTPGVTLIDDQLSKSALERLRGAMLAAGDRYLELSGFDFGGKTASEAGFLSVTTAEHIGKPQLRLSCGQRAVL